MILRFFKPSWRKIAIAVGLFFTVGFLIEFESAVSTRMVADLRETSLGQEYAAEMKRIYKEYRCEATEKVGELTRNFVFDSKKDGTGDAVERKAAFFAWVRRLLLGLLCYVAACSACSAGVYRGPVQA